MMLMNRLRKKMAGQSGNRICFEAIGSWKIMHRS
jgi:hypothetical protein